MGICLACGLGLVLEALFRRPSESGPFFSRLRVSRSHGPIPVGSATPRSVFLTWFHPTALELPPSQLTWGQLLVQRAGHTPLLCVLPAWTPCAG